MDRRRGFADILVTAVLVATIASALLLSCVFAGSSYIPYEWLKPRVDQWAIDGVADRFTAHSHDRIVGRLRLAGLALCAAGVALLLVRRRVSEGLIPAADSLMLSIRTLLQDFADHLADVWAESRRTHIVVLSAILLLGLVVRISLLTQPIRHDEAFTFTNYASKPLLVGILNYSFPNNHLFHTIQVHLACTFLGDSPWAIRIPAFLAGLLTLPACYLVLRTFYGMYAALIATAAVSMSSALIEYATNGRGYSLVCLLYLITLGIAHYLRRNNSVAGWALLAVLFAAGFYTIPIMLFAFGVIGTWLMLCALLEDSIHSVLQMGKRLLVTSVVMAGITFLLYLPVLLGSGLDSLLSNRALENPLTWRAVAERLPSSLAATWSQWTRDFPGSLDLIVAAGLLLSIVVHSRTATHRVHLAVPVLVWCLPVLFIQRVVPPERVWLFLLPLFLGIAASGFTGLVSLATGSPKIHNRIATFGALIVVGLLAEGSYSSVTEYYPYGPGTLNDAEDIAVYLKEVLEPGDKVLTAATQAPLEFYFRKHGVSIDYLRNPSAFNTRLYLVLVKHRTTMATLRIASGDSSLFARDPELVKDYRSGSLFRVTRPGP